jgi:hypothetical protein
MITTVRDIPDSYTLVTDSQEIRYILENIGYFTDKYSDDTDYGCLFVLVGDGDYDTIYGCEHSVPYLTYPVDKLYGELTYAERMIDQWGSWEVYQTLLGFEVDAARAFWSIVDSYLAERIVSLWMWDEVYKLAYDENGELWLGTYAAVIESEAESFDYDNDGELFGYLCDSIEESYTNIAESYAGTIDFDSGEVYFLCEVDID